MPTALQILRRDKQNASLFAERVGKDRARKVLERAQLELNKRLATAEGLAGPGNTTFTIAQMRAALAQVRAVLAKTQQGLTSEAVDIGKESAVQGTTGAAEYIKRAEQEYRGSSHQLPFDIAALTDTAARGAESSVLRRLAGDPSHPAQPGIVKRYGLGTIEMFEQAMQQRLIQGKSWAEARQDLTDASPFLQGKPMHWAERILRTESMYQHNAAAQDSLEQVQAAVGPMLKILVATFDHRTGADSIAVHGQIRRTSEAFHSWFGAYMHPPNRPNDREIVVPHNAAWPLPPELHQRSDAEVAARWALEGRKGSPPPRPLMSTVDLDAEKLAAQAAPPMAAKVEEPIAPPEVLKPPEEAPERAALPPIVPRFESLPKPGDGTIPALEPEPLPPEPPVDLLAQQVAPASGSNPGGVYRGSDGVDRYVKFYSDPTQAAGEHLANKIYEELGLGALDSQLFEHEGKIAYASKMLPNARRLNAALTPKNTKKALDGFAADVLLANWDAVGLSLDNMMIVPGNKVVRVDNGAALLSRAKGTRKPQHALDNPTEWSSFFNPSINPAYAKVAAAAGVGGPEDMAPSLIKGIKKIDKLAKRKGGWGAFVDEHAPSLAQADRDQIVEMLNSRTAFLRSKLPELNEVANPDPNRKIPPPIKESEIVPMTKFRQYSNDAEVPLRAMPGIRALEEYTGSSYRTMNEALYDPTFAKTYSVEARAEVHAKNAQLQACLKQAKEDGLFLEGVIYRGVKGWPGLMQEIEMGEFEFKSFSSASPDKQVATNFAGGAQPILFRLRQKSAIPIRNVSMHASESEALLPAGIRFRTIAKRPWPGQTNGIIVDAEEL